MVRDALGEVWDLTIDLVACRRVRDLAGVNLLSLEMSAIFEAFSDPIRLAEIVYAVCLPQAQQRGLSQDDFLRRLAIAMQPVVERLLEGLDRFFRQLGLPHRGTQMATAMKAVQKLETTMTTEELERLTAATFEWMSHQIPTSSSGTAHTSMPGSPESIPMSQA